MFPPIVASSNISKLEIGKRKKERGKRKKKKKKENPMKMTNKLRWLLGQTLFEKSHKRRHWGRRCRINLTGRVVFFDGAECSLGVCNRFIQMIAGRKSSYCCVSANIGPETGHKRNGNIGATWRGITRPSFDYSTCFTTRQKWINRPHTTPFWFNASKRSGYRWSHSMAPQRHRKRARPIRKL